MKTADLKCGRYLGKAGSLKKRLDVLLTEKNLAPSREKAKAYIMSGIVYVDDQKEDKAGDLFEETSKVEVRGETLRYVSRGGLKLEKAIAEFSLVLNGFICMDIGASTGGFTDCMLQNGAAKVYSVDVGGGRLTRKHRNDERVVCMEKTNFRYMVPGDIEDMLDFASVDVSFISLTKILPPAWDLLKEGGEMVCLIKPQFETTKEKVGKKGVVRDIKVHEEVVESTLLFAESIGFEILHLTYSPIKGPEGNIEYLMHIRKVQKKDEVQEDKERGSVDETEESKNDSGKNCSEEEIKRMKNWAGKVVEESHAALA